jgi:hypothetical protein
MAQTVRGEFGDASLIALKDPRICRLVPFWRRVFEQLKLEPSFVIPVRNPLDVAASLVRAEETDVAKGMLLWLQHFVAAEHDTRDLPRCFVSYDQLLRDWRAVVAKLSAALDLSLPRLGRRAEAEIDGFLKLDLQHHTSSSDELLARYDVPGWVKRVHDWAQRAVADERPDPALLDEVHAELAPAEASFGPLLASLELQRDQARDRALRAGRQLEAAHELGHDLRQQVARARDELTHAERELATREDDLAHARRQIARGEQEMARLVEWVKTVVEWQARTHGDPDSASADLEVALRAFEGAGVERVPQIAGLGVRLTQQSAEIARLAERADLARAEADALREERQLLRDALTAGQSEREQLVEKRRAEVTALEERVREQSDSARRELDSVIAERDRATREREAQHAEALREQDRTIRRLERERRFESARHEGRIQGLWQQVSARDAELAGLRDTLTAHALETATLRDHVGRHLSEIAALHQLAASRAPRARTAHVGGRARRIAQLAWWTLTLRLRARIRDERAVSALRGSLLFDADFYLAHNADVAEAGLDPLVHWVRCGAREGRDPGPHFCTSFYLEHNPDVAASGTNPLAHYLQCGAVEGRDPSPHFSTVDYRAANPIVDETGVNPLAHQIALARALGEADPAS